MAEEERGERRPYAGKKTGEKRPYTGGGNRFDKAGEPRPYESRRSESRNYKGTPRFKRDDSAPPAAGGERAEPADSGSFERSKPPRFATFEPKPRFAGKPSFGDKKFGDKKFGDKKPEGFKKKYTGKAAGAKGSYKGGKAFRDKAK